MLKEKWEALKNHVTKHRDVYITGGLCILTAGITYAIMREQHAGAQSTPDEGLIMNEPIMRSLIFSPNNINNVVNVIERDGRGHPGYLVRDLDTNEIWPSQQKTSEKTGIPESVISDHLRGKFPDAHGRHLERISA